MKTTKCRLARMALEELFGSENMGEILGSSGADDSHGFETNADASVRDKVRFF